MDGRFGTCDKDETLVRWLVGQGVAKLPLIDSRAHAKQPGERKEGAGWLVLELALNPLPFLGPQRPERCSKTGVVACPSSLNKTR